MRDEQRIERLFFHQLFKHMLGHFEISQLRQDFELQLAARARAPFLARNLEPILARDFTDKIDIACPPPRSLQIDRPYHFSSGVAMFDFE